MSKKDRGSFPFAPSAAYELQMCACYFQSEDTDVIKYAGDLLQSIEIFLIWDQHPKKVFEDSAWRGETTAMKVVVPILPKQGAGHRSYPVPWAPSPGNWFRRPFRTSGKSEKHSNMVFSSHMVVGLWSSFLWPIQFSFCISLFIYSNSVTDSTVLITTVLISSFWTAHALLFFFFILSLSDLLALHPPPCCCLVSPRLLS